MKKDYNILTVCRDKYGVIGILVGVDRVCSPEEYDGYFFAEDQYLDVEVIQDGIYLNTLEGRIYVLDVDSDKVFYLSAENNDTKDAVWAYNVPSELKEKVNTLVTLKAGLTYESVANILNV